jgi:hypothetical protein
MTSATVISPSRSAARLRAPLVLLLLLASAAPPVPAMQEIGWEDLLPEQMHTLEQEADRLDRMLEEMTPETREVYDGVAMELSARDTLEMGMLGEEELRPAPRSALASGLAARYPEAVAFWQRVAALRQEFEQLDDVLREDLDGRAVRLAGYLLPLEFDGTRVREFLLVPYVGACIHVPPPPANQTVFVRAASPYQSKGLFAPVWVEGSLKASPASYDLSLVDGSNAVQAGYVIDASRIEAYEE